MGELIELPGIERRKSAVVVTRHLGLELKRRRLMANLKRAEGAKLCGWSPRKQQMLEQGEQVMSMGDLEKVASAFEFTEEERETWRELVEAAHAKGWWDGYQDVALTPGAKRYIGYEQGATRIRAWSPLVINGLLQTQAYREAIVRRGSVVPRPGEQVVALVEVSFNRQQVLHGTDPLELCVILDEAALRRPVGAPEVMQQQLVHIADLAEQLDTVTVQVVPFAVGPHPGLGGSFDILDFEWPNESFVYVESGPDTITYKEEPEDLYTFSQLFDSLRRVALEEGASIRMLRDLAMQSLQSLN